METKRETWFPKKNLHRWRLDSGSTVKHRLGYLSLGSRYHVEREREKKKDCMSESMCFYMAELCYIFTHTHTESQ